MKEKNTYRFIISGGGTGGHIFPAIAIANKLRERYPGCSILFVGARGRMEMKKVPLAGYDIKSLWISGFQRSQMIKNILLPVKILSSLLKARKILREFKPDVAIGTGGYASFSLNRAAAGMNIPVLIQEQNSFPGMTNKWLSKFASKICVAYDGMNKYFPEEKIVITGNPVRDNIISDNDKNDCYKFFGFESGKPILLVTGGSLGAGTINNGIFKGVEEFLSNGLQVIWQTGEYYYVNIKEKLGDISNKSGLWIAPFINNMNEAYSIADLVVCRAGAISLSELAIAGKAAILVPSPNVAEDHQTKNALALVDKDAAVMIKDSDADEKLTMEINRLIKDSSALTKLRNNISDMAMPDSTEMIVNEIDKILNKQN